MRRNPRQGINSQHSINQVTQILRKQQLRPVIFRPVNFFVQFFVSRPLERKNTRYHHIRQHSQGPYVCSLPPVLPFLNDFGRHVTRCPAKYLYLNYLPMLPFWLARCTYWTRNRWVWGWGFSRWSRSRVWCPGGKCFFRGGIARHRPGPWWFSWSSFMEFCARAAASCRNSARSQWGTP